MRQTNRAIGPNKAIASGAAGMVSVIALYAAGAAGWHVPPEVASAGTGLIGTFFVWMTRHRR